MGVEQSIQGLPRTLVTTPVGWLLVAWLAWARAPHERVLLWLGGFLCVLLVSLVQVRWMMHGLAGAKSKTRLLLSEACMNGLAWGAVGGLLGGYDLTLDSCLSAVLCGVGAVAVPVYITYIRAWFVWISSIWGSILLGWLLRPRGFSVEFVVGEAIFFALLAYYMRPVARRVLDGIVLQLRNASLTEQLKDALQQVRQEADTDALTGQPNRRGLDELLKRQVEMAARSNTTFSVLVLDIDHFKLVNDTHGHGTGDDTLRAFAQRVREHLREGDTCARHGGEEFVVVLPATPLVAALEVAERLRHGVASRSLLSVPLVRATVSIGAAQYVSGETAEQMLERADTAVYAAKRAGRNQVRIPEAVPTA